MSWDGLDRRKFPRVMYPCLVKVSIADGTQESILTHTENVGRGGLCVTIRREIKLFTPVELEVDLLDADQHVHAKGKVAWSVRRKAIETVKPMFYDTGIEFTGISSADQKRVQASIERQIKQGAKLLKPFI